MDLEVNKTIPQRYPFQMIDRFNDVKPGIGSTATKLLTIDEWFFANQPADHLVAPRPVMIEAMAQTGVAAILSMDKNKGKNVFFGGIPRAEFKDDFRPGDKLTLAVKLKKIRGNIGLGHGTITREGKEICTADLIFAIE